MRVEAQPKIANNRSSVRYWPESPKETPRKIESQMKTAVTPNPLLLLVFGLFIIWGFGFSTVGLRLILELNGVVVSSHDRSAKGAPRYVTEYILRGDDGREFSYKAGPTDASLPRSLPVGTRLLKRKWRLSYEENGQIMDDFPTSFYAIVVGIGLALILWSFLLFRERRRSKNQPVPS
jgi:hypothetical protein